MLANFTTRIQNSSVLQVIKIKGMYIKVFSRIIGITPKPQIIILRRSNTNVSLVGHNLFNEKAFFHFFSFVNSTSKIPKQISILQMKYIRGEGGKESKKRKRKWLNIKKYHFNSSIQLSWQKRRWKFFAPSHPRWNVK